MENGISEVFKYLKIVYKRRYVFIAVSALIMTAIVIYSYTLPKKYKADSTVFIEKNVINSLVKGIAITPDMDERIRVLQYALLSRDLISKVLSDLDVAFKSEKEYQKTLAELQKRTNISIKGKDLFIVSIVDKNPVFARDYINKLVSTYVEDNLSGKRQETYGANRFLDEQLAHFKEKLDEAEDKIINFRRSQGVFLSVDEKTLLGDIKNIQGQIEDINLSTDTLNAKKNKLQKQLKGISPTVSLFSEGTKKNHIAQLEERLNLLLLSYTPNYPEVIQLKAEIEALKKSNQGKEETSSSDQLQAVNPIFQDLQPKIYDIEAELSSLAAKKAKLLKMKDDRQGELQFVPENQKKLAVLSQERDSYRKIYEDLLMRSGQSEVSKQMEIADKTTTFRIVDAAMLPTVPVSPNMVRMILLAIIGGLGCGLGGVVVLETLKTTVKDADQIRSLGIEVLAIIPTMVNDVTDKKRHRKDVFAYLFSSLYILSILSLLGYELMKGKGYFEAVKKFIGLV